MTVPITVTDTVSDLDRVPGDINRDAVVNADDLQEVVENQGRNDND